MLDPITLTVTIVVAAAVVILLALGIWILLAARSVRRTAATIAHERDQLERARATHAEVVATTPNDVSELAEADDWVQSSRRAVNAATREGEALRKRFPTSLFAGRIPQPQYEEATGGTAEPPRIAF